MISAIDLRNIKIKTVCMESDNRYKMRITHNSKVSDFICYIRDDVAMVNTKKTSLENFIKTNSFDRTDVISAITDSDFFKDFLVSIYDDMLLKVLGIKIQGRKTLGIQIVDHMIVGIHLNDNGEFTLNVGISTTKVSKYDKLYTTNVYKKYVTDTVPSMVENIIGKSELTFLCLSSMADELIKQNIGDIWISNKIKSDFIWVADDMKDIFEMKENTVYSLKI